MSHYIEFTLPDGSTVFVESDERKGAATRAARGPADVAKQAGETFERAVENARKSALVVLREVLKDSAPEVVEITFGLKASGELNSLVVAKAGVEASYSIKLTWKKPEEPRDGNKP